MAHTMGTTKTTGNKTTDRLRRQFTFATLQDGAPSKSDGEVLLHSLSMIARGNQRGEIHLEKSMNGLRHSVGLYADHPLANGFLAGSSHRETAFKESGAKQMNHVRGTDGWFRSMLVLEVRAIDNYILPFCVICLNAVVCTLLNETAGVEVSDEKLKHWDTVFSVVLKTSLAFLLVFRLNRCAMRFWEARGLWGNLTHATRNLVGGILMYGGDPGVRKHRDAAIRWASAFCVAAMHFIRSEHEFDAHELHGILAPDQVTRMKNADHAPLYAATMVRHSLRKLFPIHEATPAALGHAHAVRTNTLEGYVSDLVAQVSGMEKIRSTPLPVAYVTHLRTFLFGYCLLLPYIWVNDWHWATPPLVAFTAFALLGIEGVSSEVEIPFDRSRPNHLAMDAYCLVILNSVQGLVVQQANLDMMAGGGGLEAWDEEPSGNLGTDETSLSV